MGSFGQDCAEECQCWNGALCDSVTGVCNCTVEWSGALCNISEFRGVLGLEEVNGVFAGSCSDGVRSNSETGVDCGGDICPPCPAEETEVSYRFIPFCVWPWQSG